MAQETITKLRVTRDLLSAATKTLDIAARSLKRPGEQVEPKVESLYNNVRILTLEADLLKTSIELHLRSLDDPNEPEQP